MSFWYGMPWSEAASMPMAAYEAYMTRLPQRFAELKLILAEVIALPYLLAEERNTMINDWKSTMRGSDETPAASPEILALMGIGVRHA